MCPVCTLQHFFFLIYFPGRTGMGQRELHSDQTNQRSKRIVCTNTRSFCTDFALTPLYVCYRWQNSLRIWRREFPDLTCTSAAPQTPQTTPACTNRDSSCRYTDTYSKSLLFKSLGSVRIIYFILFFLKEMYFYSAAKHLNWSINIKDFCCSEKSSFSNKNAVLNLLFFNKSSNIN